MAAIHSEQFGTWHRALFLSEGDTYEQKWAATQKLLEECGHEEIEVLARAALATKPPMNGGKDERVSKAYSIVVEHVRSAMPDFDPDQHGMDFRFMAAAALALLAESSADAALATTTTYFGGNRTVDLPMDLPTTAENAIRRLAVNRHSRLSEDKFRRALPTLSHEFSAESLNQSDPAALKAELEALRDKTNKALRAIVSGQNQVMGQLVDRLTLADEELQILWWLTGGVSTALQTSFEKLEPKSRPLVLASEIGGLTKVSPGPMSIGAMLARAGANSRKLTVVEAVAAAPEEWASEMSRSGNISPATTPIHFAIDKRVEMDSDEAWPATWAAMSGLSGDTRLSGLELGELFYREYLFLNVT